MRRLLGIVVVLGANSCTTLENRRDLYSPDSYLYPQRTTTTTVRETITTTKPAAVEFRPHADHD